MSRFYSFTYQQVTTLDVDVFNMYLRGILELTAEESLNAITVADFPHLKKDSRSQSHKRLHKQAFPMQYLKPVNIVKFEDVNRMMNG